MSLTRKKMLEQFVSKNKPVIALALSSAFISSFCSVLLPLSIGSFYDVALGESSGKNELMSRIGLSITSVDSFFLFFTLLTILKGVLTWLEHVTMRIVEERLTHDVRGRLFHAQVNHDFDSFHTKSIGKYLTRYSSDMLAIQQYVSKGMIKPVADGLFLITAFSLLFQLNSKLSGALLIVFITGSIIMVLVSSLQKLPNEKRRNDRSSLLGFIEQRLHGIATIKAFNRAHPEEDKFAKRNNKLYSSSIRFQLVNGLNKALPQVVFFTAIGILLSLSLQQESEKSASSLLIFILILLYLQSVYKRLLRVPSLVSSGSTSIDNLLNVLNLPHEVMHAGIEPTELRRNLSIQFRNLSFEYTTSHPIISNINAELKPGNICHIQGKAGSGKSTLFRLLLKLHKVEKGHLFISGHDICDIGAHDLRKLMTTIGDDFPLLGNTIFEAISYSRKEAKRTLAAEVLTKLGLCSADDSDNYLNRRLLRTSSDLSSAEKKMLQFARAILTKKPIILLDEPFIGLNPENLQVMTDKLLSLRRDSIILIISREIPQGLNIDHSISL